MLALTLRLCKSTYIIANVYIDLNFVTVLLENTKFWRNTNYLCVCYIFLLIVKELCHKVNFFQKNNTFLKVRK
jgi:hypothetical protein